MSQSSVFSHSARQIRLLEYLCNKVLLGEKDQIKAATIAMEVFGRRWDFDETKDAVVRVEAHRLRKKLAQYYDRDGAGERVRILLSPGGYVPEFEIVEEAAVPADAAIEVATADIETGRDDQNRESDRPAATATAGGFWTRPWVVGAASAALVLLGVVAALVALRPGSAEAKRESSAVVPVPAPRGSVPPGEVRILCGRSTGPYTDRFGRTWSADAYSDGGKAEPGPMEFYGVPPDAGLFATMRTGEFSYRIPVAPGVYELRLYWAEPTFRPSIDAIGGGENQRRFNVSLNGKSLLEKFDVVADSGISPVDVRVFKDVSPGEDGKVHIAFSASYGTPFLNGLELIPSAPARSVPVRLRAHDLSYTDHLGRHWTADNYYVGGRLAKYKHHVAGTSDPGLYGGERYGNFNYVIPVAKGTYRVTLHFAETWFRPDSTGEDKGGKGDRVFDVYCNGLALLENFDIFAHTGPFRALSKTFRGIRPNGQGKIVLTFSPQKNYAAVKAIEVVDE